MNISFCDFWGDFNEKNNFFSDLIKDIHSDFNIVPFSNEHTDILIYSCFGTVHQKADRSKVKKIFYTGENKRPNLNECDYSISFDFDDYDGKNIRLPLWLLQIDWFNKIDYGNPKFVIPENELRQSRFLKNIKNKFCCIVFNNPIPNRIEIINKLSKYKKIDCYGNLSGNHFYGEDKKYEILSNYKFNICFENGLYPGYYTEKPIHAKVAGCVPVYWADKYCENDFNTKSFLNLNDYNSIDDLIEKIIYLDQNENDYEVISNEYLFENKNPRILFDKIKTQIKNIL